MSKPASKRTARGATKKKGSLRKEPKSATKKKPKAKQEEAFTGGPRSEREGEAYHAALCKFIRKSKARYIRAEDGSLHLMLERRRIPLSVAHDNYDLAKLMLTVCDVSTLPMLALTVAIITALDTWLKPGQLWRASTVYVVRFNEISDKIRQASPNDVTLIATLRAEFRSLQQKHINDTTW
jgi:hypothetical protein